MEQYAKTLISSLTGIMDKSKIDKVFTKKLQRFLTNYFQMMNVIGIKDYSTLNQKVNSENLTRLAYKTSLKQADSKRFATGCKTEKCMRTKMACNIIDNIMMLVPLSMACKKESNRNRISEVLNYANNNGTYRYLLNVAESMYGKASGVTNVPIVDPIIRYQKLEKYIQVYNTLKLQLSKYY